MLTINVLKLILFCIFVFFRYVGSKHKLALLLDYDGTLAPIAPHPDLAILPPETRNVLERLSNMSDVYIAIVSGRNVVNVKEMVIIFLNCLCFINVSSHCILHNFDFDRLA